MQIRNPRIFRLNRAGPAGWFWRPRILSGRGAGFRVLGLTVGPLGISIDY